MTSATTTNLIAYDDDSGAGAQFRFTVDLKVEGIYFLVVTTVNPNSIGPFDLIVTGVANVTLTRQNGWSSRISRPRMFLSCHF
jgi:hypothetical protein